MFDKKLIKNFDFIILFLIFCLVGFGIVGIGTATGVPSENPENTNGILPIFSSRYAKLQMIWFFTGLVLMFVVLSVDYRVFANMAPYIYWLSVVLLLYVNVKGDIAGGARSWIKIGAFKVQPSEFAKIAIIITLAKYLSSKEKGIQRIKNLAVLTVKILIPLMLIILQPDFGTAMVFVAILLGVLFVSRIDLKWLIGIICAGIACIPAVWFLFLSEIQKQRIRVFFNPNLDPLGHGYNVLQSKIAIGSGRIYGKLIANDNPLSQLNFLPAKHTDFIFSVTVEALGFVGGIIIIGLYLLLILRTIYLATRAKDLFGSLLIIGVASMIVFHVFENIGMTMGIMPVTGIPLPFMSYGGSFMWTNMIAYGLVLNVAMRRHKLSF